MYKNLKVVGLMSGTSADGIDMSLNITNGISLERTKYKEINSYSKKTKLLISNAMDNPNLILNNYILKRRLEKRVTLEHAITLDKFLKENEIYPDLIGFHGQTIFHDSKKKISVQIGDGKLLFKLLKIPVISNFRDNDMRNGGEGAPIAPIYHKYLIQNLKLNLPSCFINIGGVSNVTYWDGDDLIGFDTGPGNALIDKFMQSKFNKSYDNQGRRALKGNPNDETVKKFLLDPFFDLPFPKSLDKFYFLKYYNSIYFTETSPHDVVSTLSEMTVASIVNSLKKLPKLPKLLVVMGGGMNNFYFLSRLKELLKIEVITADDINIPGEFIEAELISFLAARKYYNLPITFPSTTGVNRAVTGGLLFK